MLTLLRRPTMKSDTMLRSASAAAAAFASRNTQHDRLNSEERHMAMLLRQSTGRTSALVPFLFLCSSFGKLILGFGTSLAVKAHYAHQKTELIVGIVLSVLGFIGCVLAALGFGAAASKVNKRRGLIFKVISISGASLIGLGYSLNQYYVSTVPVGHHRNIRLSFLPLMFGTGLMSISLPNFTAYTELLRGRIPFIPIDYRRHVALGCMSPSLGMLFAGWISGEHADWPPVFNVVVLSFSVACALFGIAIFFSDNLRWRAELYERLLCEEELEMSSMDGSPDPDLGVGREGKLVAASSSTLTMAETLASTPVLTNQEKHTV